MNPVAQQQQPDEPLQAFRVVKLWNIAKADYVYIVQQQFKHTEYKGSKPVSLDYWRPVANAELDEEMAKKNAEHYGVAFPTEELDVFAEAAAQQKLAEKLGLV